MRRDLSTAIALTFSLFLAGCAATSPPIRVEGGVRALKTLEGEWSGAYESGGSRGRSGSIVFTLEAGDDHAHGDVLMTPAGGASGYGRLPTRDPFGQWDERVAPPEALTIHFVRLDERRVSGALDPYWDPDRECWASTTFAGELVENTIAGTFKTTFAEQAADLTGTWRVTRRPPAK